MTRRAGEGVPVLGSRSRGSSTDPVGRARPAWFAPLALATAVLVVVGVVTLAPVLEVGRAHACSCASPGPATDLVGERDVAFVGTAAPGREIEQGVLVHDVTVETAVKGDLPAVVQIAAGTSEASCGISVPTGVPIGFVPSSFGPTGRSDEWSVDLCSGLVDAAELRAVVGARLPAPTGTGPVSALVIARAGPAEAVAVAADGRPAGWIDLPPVEGFVDLLSAAVCPGGVTAALLLARYDEIGQQTSSAVHLLDLATLEVSATPAFLGDPVVFGPWSIGSSACIDAAGTIVSVVDRDGDGTPSELHRIGSDGLTVERLDGAAAIDGTRLVQVVDGTVVRRDLVATGSASTPMFALDVVPIDLDLFGDTVVVTSRDTESTVLVERHSADGAVTASWRVDAVDTARVTVAASGALLWDGTTGRQRWLRDDGEVLNVSGTSGGALLGDGVLSWSYEGGARFVLSDGSEDAAWSFLSGPGIRFAVPIAGTVAVEPTAAAAQALPVIDRPGRILPAGQVATTVAVPDTTTSDTAATDENAAPTVAPTDEASAGHDTDDSPETIRVLVLVLVVLVAVAVALAAVSGRIRRSRRSAGADPASTRPQ